MQNQYAVSVIVPVFNAGEPLRRCLQSLCGQTVAGCEIIVINDASKNPLDQSIIDEFAALHDNVVPIVLKNNVPVGQVRNKGIDQARGTYIGFVDADDYVDPAMFESLIDVMETDRSDLAICRRNEFYDDGSFQSMGFRNLLSGRKIVVNNSAKELDNLLLGMTPFVWDKLYKREIIERQHLRMPSTRYSEDAVFVMEYVAFCSKVSLLNRALYFYNCESPSGVTNAFSASWLDIPQSMQVLVDFYKRQGGFFDHEQSLCRIAANTWAARMRTIHLYSDRKLLISFVDSYHDLFAKNFKDVEKRLERWFPDVCRFYNKRYAHFMVSLPPVLKAYNPSYVKEKLSEDRVAYASYRKTRPVRKNTVFVISNSNGVAVDSPFYLMKDLLARPGITVYTAAYDPWKQRVLLDQYGLEPVIVKWRSKDHFKLLATAQVLITNTVLPEYFNKRPGQTVLNTWHGTPLKTLGYDMLSSWKELGNSQSQFMMSDYLLYPNDAARERIMHSYRLDELFCNKVLMCGYPRNEVFLDEARRRELRSELAIDGVKSFVYMPTWRGDGIYARDFTAYQQSVIDMLDRLDEALADDVVVFVKLHRYMEKGFSLMKYSHIRAYNPMYEPYDVLNAVDGLITDYSSVMFDYAISRRPIILFMYDYDEYMADRGMYDDPKAFPFVQVESPEELGKFLNDIDVSGAYLPDHHAFIEQFCSYDSPRNSANVNDAVLGISDVGVSVLDYAKNADRQWHVVFADKVFDSAEGRELIESSHEGDILLAFTKKNFNDRIEGKIRSLSRPPIVVIMPDMPPIAFIDNCMIRIHRKTGLFTGVVRRFYRNELGRLLPGVRIGKMTDCSGDVKFRELLELVGATNKRANAGDQR